MTTFIGITQDLEETAENMVKDCQGMHIGSEFGPFKSANDAQCWREYLIQRNAEVAPATVAPATSEGGAWYGFTLESDDEDIR